MDFRSSLNGVGLADSKPPKNSAGLVTKIGSEGSLIHMMVDDSTAQVRVVKSCPRREPPPGQEWDGGPEMQEMCERWSVGTYVKVVGFFCRH